MKIYVVMFFSLYDCTHYASRAFTSKEKAEDYIKTHKGCSIEEVELHVE